MPSLFWDASGLAKYYTEENGSETAEALFLSSLPLKMITTPWGYVETFSLLQRKRNDKRISKNVFDRAVSRLRADIIVDPIFLLVTVSDTAIIGGIEFIQNHHLNSTDAALLATLLRYAQTAGETCVLVAADGRFCRAAQAEGLTAINPETMPAADVPAFLAALP